MEATFADKKLISRQRLKDLQRRADGPSLQRLGVQCAALLVTAAGLATLESRLALGLLLPVHAVVHFGFFGVFHESGHKTAFATPWLNDLAGWVAALSHPMSPALLRAFHFAHHRHTHDLDGDPELAGLPFVARWPRGVVWLVTMTGLPILTARVVWMIFAALVPWGPIWRRVLPFVDSSSYRRVAWEARILMAMHGALLAVAWWLWPPLGWYYVGMLAGHMILTWYTTCEHRGLPLADQASILNRTRSLIVPRWVCWLLWNMPYHAEHHAYPSVPWHALEALHRDLQPHLGHRESVFALHWNRGCDAMHDRPDRSPQE